MLALDVRQMVAISASTILSDSIVGVDVFACAGEDSEPILFVSKEETIKPSKLRQILNEGVLKLYIGKECFQKYQTYLRDHWKQILDDKNLSIATRTSVLNEVLLDAMNVSFRTGDTETIVNATQTLGAGIVKVFGEEKVLVSRLSAVLHHDFATFTHSANVACYAALLAKHLGYSAKEQKEIVVGALLHDVGKLSIDERILRKPGRLDEFEFREVQKHPLLGYRQLANRNDLSYAQLMMVYQHHEKLDGTGYPVGIIGEEIHPWARLCAVVDIFEALTSTRPYRSPMDHKVALTILQKEAGKQLDAQMVEAWSELVIERGSLK